MSSYWAQKSRAYKRSNDARGTPRQPRVAPTTTATPPPPLGTLLQVLKAEDFQEASQPFTNSAVIRDVEAIASYNWVDKEGFESTILVPGKPPRWTPPASPPLLREDSGTYFRDKNAARYPKHPVEPGVLACLDADPSLPSKIDVVACGSTMGNLLRFVRRRDTPFRLLVEKVDRTVFFIRRENSPTELIQGVRGFGHTFPEAYTTWEADVKGSSSHQRLLCYTFGSLHFVVRFEADGYIKSSGAESGAHTTPNTRRGGEGNLPSMDELSGALSSTSMASKAPQSATAVQVKDGGSFVSQRDVFDLKTRSIYTKETKDHLGEELPRLWVAQIPTFILAFHTKGLFKAGDIQIKDVRADIKQWEKDHASNLAHLAVLIHKIVGLVSDSPRLKLELCYKEVGKLEVREQLPDAGDVLSTEVRARWMRAASAGLKSPPIAGKAPAPTTPRLKTTVSTEGLSNETSNHGQDGEGVDFKWEDDYEGDLTGSSDGCGYCGRCPH